MSPQGTIDFQYVEHFAFSEDGTQAILLTNFVSPGRFTTLYSLATPYTLLNQTYSSTSDKYQNFSNQTYLNDTNGIEVLNISEDKIYLNMRISDNLTKVFSIAIDTTSFGTPTN